jgi:hypothetical protein
LPPSRAFTPELFNQVLADSSLRTRVVGLNYAAAIDTALYDAYLRRLAVILPPNFDASSTENYYDAVYFLVYAAVGGGSGGTNMSAGMARLLAGPRYDIGPDGIDAIVDRLLLRSDTSLSFYGTLGPPDFDKPTGSRVAYSNAWCVDAQLRYVMDVLRYDPFSRELSGTFSCFNF